MIIDCCISIILPCSQSKYNSVSSPLPFLECLCWALQRWRPNYLMSRPLVIPKLGAPKEQAPLCEGAIVQGTVVGGHIVWGPTIGGLVVGCCWTGSWRPKRLRSRRLMHCADIWGREVEDAIIACALVACTIFACAVITCNVIACAIIGGEFVESAIIGGAFLGDAVIGCAVVRHWHWHLAPITISTPPNSPTFVKACSASNAHSLQKVW